jgi:D-3-phosphoglycerate dehydrogenase
MSQVLLLEKVHTVAIELFQKEGYQVESYEKLTKSELLDKVKDVHILGYRSKTEINQEVLEAAKKLIVTGAFCIGTDQTDLPFAASKGVAVFNAPFANTRSVAEMIIAEIIMLARQIGDRNQECHKKYWNKQSGGCWEVRGKTVGIVGYGHVGSQVSVLAEAMGMHVLYYDHVPKLPLGNAVAVETLQEVLTKSDFVSMHVPLTEETENMISGKQLALMKKGSYFLNASRGPVVDVQAVADAIKSGHLAGCAFDVFPVEPAQKGEELTSQLIGLPNTILTPHIGGSTEEAQGGIGREVAGKIINYINTGNTLGAVNFPEMQMTFSKNSYRLCNVHKNVPGVLRDVNNVLASYNVNAQTLLTKDKIGYMVVDVDKEFGIEVKEKLEQMESNIKTRVLF